MYVWLGHPPVFPVTVVPCEGTCKYIFYRSLQLSQAVLGSFQNCVLAPDFWPYLVSVGSGESFRLCILCNSGCAVTLCKGLMSFSYGLEILTLKTKMRNK